jgi:VWFA-related protein
MLYPPSGHNKTPWGDGALSPERRHFGLILCYPMKKQTCIRGVILAAAMLVRCVSIESSADQSSPTSPTSAQPDQSASSSHESKTIALNVVVTDRNGDTIQGLPTTAFTVLDNNQPRGLDSFREVSWTGSSPEPPATVILVLDAYNEQSSTLLDERRGLEEYFRGDKIVLPTSLIVLTEQGMKIQNHPTRDGKVLSDFLKQNPGGLGTTRPWSFEDDLQRAKSSLETLRSLAKALTKTPGRKLILWVGRSWGEMRFSHDPHKEDEMGFRYTADLYSALQDAGISLYSLDMAGVGEGTFRPGLPGGDPLASKARMYSTNRKPKHFDEYALTLPVIALQPGGQALFRNNDLSAMIEKCVADARSYYVLTLERSGSNSPNEFHGIEIQMGQPGLTARTTVAYYAQP